MVGWMNKGNCPASLVKQAMQRAPLHRDKLQERARHKWWLVGKQFAQIGQQVSVVGTVSISIKYL